MYSPNPIEVSGVLFLSSEQNIITPVNVLQHKLSREQELVFCAEVLSHSFSLCFTGV